MADNRLDYGFRWNSAANGGRSLPSPVECIVATSEAFNVNAGAQAVGLGPGDPVRRLSTGGVTLCDGAEGAGGALAPFGIVVGVAPYWDVGTSRMVRGNVLPSTVAWGTLLERQSKVLVVPVDAGIWEIDAGDNTTSTTESGYQAFIGENADHNLYGASGDLRSKPRLKISTHATTSTLVWNIVGISKTAHNQDFTGQYVKLLVRANVIQLKTAGLAGV